LAQEVFDLITLVLFKNGKNLSLKSGLYSTRVPAVPVETVKEFIVNNLKDDNQEDLD